MNRRVKKALIRTSGGRSVKTVLSMLLTVVITMTMIPAAFLSALEPDDATVAGETTPAASDSSSSQDVDFGSKGVGQPEIVEKARKCEALGAEVIQLTVGPELFYTTLSVLEDTGYFNASLYSPFGIAGVETLGYEIAMQCREKLGKDPDMVVCTNAGGGMVTGTARGLIKAGCKDTKVVAASIDLTGLSMASDVDFNRKSCTTGHTGFGVPYATDPDHSDVPRSAARPLRYMDEYVTTTQGEVMYMTEMLANLEGLERGPAGNTALAAAFSLAQELPEDAVLVVSETEYTGAGKHIQPQLAFAKQNGIDVRFGDPQTEDKPGTNVILPKDPSYIKHKEKDEPQYMGEDREHLVLYAKEYIESHPNIDYFIFGHRHIELDIKLARHTRLMILGDWISQFTYAVYDGEHMFMEEYVEGESRP